MTRSGEPRINEITAIFRGINRDKEPVPPTVKRDKEVSTVVRTHSPEMTTAIREFLEYHRDL